MESRTTNNVINAMRLEVVLRIRKKLRRIEAVYNVLKEKEKKGSLTSRQKNMLRDDESYLKNISKHLKNLKSF